MGTSNLYFTFALGSEVYGVDARHVREVLPFGRVAVIPRSPPWIRGLMNLRGNLVTVVDLKTKLGMGPTHAAQAVSVVIIIELELFGELTYAGILADAVQDVIEYAPSDLEPAPQFGSRLSTSLLAGMGRHESGVFLVLDLKVLFGGSTPKTFAPRSPGDRDSNGISPRVAG